MSYSILQKITLLFLLITVGTFGKASGQNTNHIIEYLNAGEIYVLKTSDTVVDQDGKRIINIEYQAITIANIGLEKCLEVIKTTSLHKYYVNNAIKTEKTKVDSGDEWLNYYSFKGVGKMPDYDCVLKMKIIESSNAKSFAIIGSSSPDALKDKGLERIEYYEVICIVRELDGEKIEISLFTKFKPFFDAADWRIKMWYPDPVYILEGISYAAKNAPNKYNYLVRN